MSGGPSASVMSFLSMPIRPENAARYPKDWKQIRERILERGGHKCEQCGVGNYELGYRDSAGDWNPCLRDDESAKIPMLGENAVRELGYKPIRIVLTIAHLDHTPENCDPSNLRAWCQKCHLAYDQEHHQQNARITRRNGKAIADLFK